MYNQLMDCNIWLGQKDDPVSLICYTFNPGLKNQFWKKILPPCRLEISVTCNKEWCFFEVDLFNLQSTQSGLSLSNSTKYNDYSKESRTEGTNLYMEH